MKLDFEKFLADNNLKLGDMVRLKNRDNTVYRITMNFMTKFLYLENVDTGTPIDIQYLTKIDFELVKPKKKVGDLICYDIAIPKKCDKCPLQCITCGGYAHDTIRERFEATLIEYPELEPMKDYFEKEFDKEVEE